MENKLAHLEQEKTAKETELTDLKVRFMKVVQVNGPTQATIQHPQAILQQSQMSLQAGHPQNQFVPQQQHMLVNQA
jgi:hypothetical protein